MNVMSLSDNRLEVNSDSQQFSDHSVTTEVVRDERLTTETAVPTATIGTDTPITVATHSAVVSVEVPMNLSSTTTPAILTTSTSHDVTDTEHVHQKKAGHHFYYTTPSSTTQGNFDDFRRMELPRTSSSDSNDSQQLQQHQVSLQLQQDQTYSLRREQTMSSKFPSSPMVTPPVHKSYLHGTSSSSKQTSEASTNVPTPSHDNRNMLFPQITQPQLRQQQQQQSSQNHGVPHVYHDYICHTSWNGKDDEDASTFTRKKTGGVSQPFPEKLHEMLTTVENTNESDIVTWLPHGRAFIVRRPKEFTDLIMPKYFKQTKLTSFQRQLNLYGFRRLTQGADAGAYYHELFLRVRPSLCQRMTRQKVKGTGHKQPADAKTEPNFYEMSAPSLSSSTTTIQQPAPKPTSLTRVTSQLSYASQLPPQQSSSSQSMLDNHELQNIDTMNESTCRMQPQQLQYDVHHRGTMNSVSLETYRSNIRSDSILDSPGLQCAAHLLQGIASGYIKNNLNIPTSDALSTGGLENGTDEEIIPLERSSDTKSGDRRSTAFLQPRLSNEYR